MEWNPQWGSMAAVFGIIGGILLLALVGYLGKFFTPTKETERLEAKLTRAEKDILEKLTELKRMMEQARLQHEERYVTMKEFNGLGGRLDDIKEQFTEVQAESRAAFNLANGASSDVRHLTKRLEEVIGDAMKELREEVKELAKAYRQRPGGPNA